MIFIVDKKPSYIEECPFYDYKTELCHGSGRKEDPECWDGWEETFNVSDCPYFVSFWGDILPVVRRLIKDGEENG